MYMVIEGFNGYWYNGYIPKGKICIVGDDKWLFYNGVKVCEMGSDRQKGYFKEIK